MSSLHYQFSALIKKSPPGLCQLHAVIVPDEELDPKLIFQLADLPAQRWLGDVQLLGGLTEIERLCHRKEIAYVTQFHEGVFYTGKVLPENYFPAHVSHAGRDHSMGKPT
ncbi:MAG TPA: hypothetical protein VEF05_01635 [Terriglobales bacterium]|nr:hypothetical protein [Terriglobales bacterium]